MSPKSQQIASMIDMLPENEQLFAFELIKRLIKAWDPDYTKLTADERRELEEVEASGEYISDPEIDWNNLQKYAD